MKTEIFSLIFLALISSLILINIPSSESIGLNYKTSTFIVESGDSFCISDYSLFNTETKEMSGYIEVEGDLIKFLPYYDLLSEKIEKENQSKAIQEQMSQLLDQINEKKNNSEDYTALQNSLGVLDTQLQNLNSEINELNKKIELKKDVQIVTVPGLGQEILNQYKNNSAGLREYLTSNNLIKQIKICLEAPRIEKEIQGNCYTKYYSGQVVLIPVEISQGQIMGSTVSMRVSAPLEIQVRCKEGGKNNVLLWIIIIILILAAVYVVFKLIRRRKRW